MKRRSILLAVLSAPLAWLGFKLPVVADDEMAANGQVPVRFPHWEFKTEYEELCREYREYEGQSLITDRVDRNPLGLGETHEAS